MKYQWISWYWTKEMGGFELHYPWWSSGWRCSDEAETICAAIPVETESEAEEIILASYDKRPKNVEWRFNNLKEAKGPFCDRFPRAKWMKWPKAS